MAVKFVSKNSNYMIVLKSGIEGSRALGTQAIPGLYIKFQSGTVDIKEDSIVEMLRSHPGYGTDFIEVKEQEADPYQDNREEIEPDHIVSEIKYGHVEKSVGRPRKIKLTPQLKKAVEAEALKMLPGLLKSNPKILKDIILSLAAEMKAGETSVEENSSSEKQDDSQKRGPERPAKAE